MERVVDRSELLSEHSTPPSSPAPEDIKNLAQFEFVRREDGATGTGNGDQDDVDEMDFCLFAPTAAGPADTSTVAKIRIQTPPLTDREPGILSSRPESYYFTHLTQDEKENIKLAALSGEEILSRSHSACPGSAYDWKVLHIPATKRQRLLLSRCSHAFPKLVGDGLDTKRKRPGKKARLKFRVKISAAKAKKEAALKAAEEKEAAEREKRTRRNREKKVKKRQRDKLKKAAGGSVIDDADDSEGSPAE